MKLYTISKAEAGQRIDKYMLKLLPNVSKSFIYKMFRKKNITLNNKKINGNESIQRKDEIKIYFSDETFEKFSGPDQKEKAISSVNSKIKLDIIFEDDHILVCNKPVGILSQPNGKDLNMVDLIESYYGKNYEKTTFKPGVCNRLDRNTTGIIIAGKNIEALQKINQEIKEKTARKFYMTIVKGIIKESKEIEGYLQKDREKNQVKISKNTEGDYIKTSYEPISSSEEYTLLKVRIFTGKSHQIRGHLAYIGHPIIGDTKYGNQKVNHSLNHRFGLKHQLLHAREYIVLNHEFIAPYPKEFVQITKELIGFTL